MTYQSLGHAIQASISFWEVCELRGMHKPMEIQWDFIGMMRSIKKKYERVVERAMVGKGIVEHTPIDEVFWVAAEFSGDNNAPQVGEVLEDNSTVVEEMIDTKASRSMMELLDNSHLQLASEHVVCIGLSMEEQSKAPVELVMGEDVQPSLGLAIEEGHHRGHTLGFQHSSLHR